MNKEKSKQYAIYKNLGPQEEKEREKKEMFEVTQVSSLGHRKSLIEQNEIVCIYLWGEFCGPCKILAPHYTELSQQYNNPGKCILVKENVEGKYTEDYDITGIPAFIFYKNGHIIRQNGKIVDVIGGDFDKVKDILNKLLQN